MPDAYTLHDIGRIKMLMHQTCWTGQLQQPHGRDQAKRVQLPILYTKLSRASSRDETVQKTLGGQNDQISGQKTRVHVQDASRVPASMLCCIHTPRNGKQVRNSDLPHLMRLPKSTQAYTMLLPPSMMSAQRCCDPGCRQATLPITFGCRALSISAFRGMGRTQ